MPTQVVTYIKGIALVSPVYLDSNLLTYSLVETRAKHTAARSLLSELLVQQVEIYISTLTLQAVFTQKNYPCQPIEGEGIYDAFELRTGIRLRGNVKCLLRRSFC